MEQGLFNFFLHEKGDGFEDRYAMLYSFYFKPGTNISMLRVTGSLMLCIGELIQSTHIYIHILLTETKHFLEHLEVYLHIVLGLWTG